LERVVERAMTETTKTIVRVCMMHFPIHGKFHVDGRDVSPCPGETVESFERDMGDRGFALSHGLCSDPKCVAAFEGTA
jgi:hypothetical protein